MLKRYFLMSLLVLVGNLAVSPLAFASNKSEKEAKFAEKVKTEIAKLGVGKDARIKVKLKDGTKLKGYVSEINDNDFSVTNAKTGKATVISYSSAKQVKGNNLSSGTIITLAFVAAIIVILFVVAKSAQ